MVRLYRLNELSRRYPSFIFVLHADRWDIQIMNPFCPSYWQAWCSPLFRGMRRLQARWLLGLVAVTVYSAEPEGE